MYGAERRVQGPGFWGVESRGSEFRAWRFELLQVEVEAVLRHRAWGVGNTGLCLQGLGCRVQGPGFRVQDSLGRKV